MTLCTDTRGMRERNGLLIIRWAIVALMLTLGLVLIARGNAVIGALVTAMAALRIVLFVRLRHRRNELRERWAGRRPFA